MHVHVHVRINTEYFPRHSELGKTQNSQRISMESCDIGEDSVQSFTRLMHNVHSELTALNISGNRAIGVTGVIIQEAGKKMKELWIVNCDCGEDLETRIRNFLVERKFGRTCIHHPWEPPGHEEEAKPVAEAKPPDGQEEQDKKAAEEERDKKAEEEEKDKEDEETDSSESKGEGEEKEDEEDSQEPKKDEPPVEEAGSSETAAELEDHDDDNILHVGHAHNEACTLECSRMVGMPSLKPPPVPVVYPETAFAARDAQAAIKKIEDAKPYWGLEAMKDMKEKNK
ncbi:hypothetical protein Mp_1g13300 [Marchantia polymorpha subsp. ruderalis]|uniref:Uncharacterized protein n=2 Tax=Marchantia polymorpha TaxID=3197 RepID=A0AAF6APP2_MARPO|nr:hypothetical protein MARPO_0019s0100 [Marchantia polymorpha]BBM98412.1 hypothetical protein Mp_1g13300 [Marchantia polymorpha subsp. ruderalis]|eukprot:PTQ44681.1 hypothetical protein MARPO_0019s0100 [Marchantia polymorpha]